MRAALWFLFLFAVAVALSLFLGVNQSVVTLFWPPYRVDLSLNLVILLWVLSFVALYATLRGTSLLAGLPQKAQRWRTLQRERAVHQGLLGRGARHLHVQRCLGPPQERVDAVGPIGVRAAAAVRGQ